ncbi:PLASMODESMATA CALLOSE-BINDING PROTEIN 3-like [Rhodamnia argentea]|uniref:PLASMODESMATA CALLOSE-BINDING PROTEIN 3-like n=1 Tax=Rhodamnia argentea TaxID=178133 RepID=A0ABM3HEI2_9MYRT|nr:PLASMODESMATA CALLOSE-BINDING PROTEIN 3-like [Rhodamnia argentea]XP_048135003.1 PLASMODESMATA CALLOSE-BINDING PROTEIN 3-like [Rhodamnia argentea]
MAVLVFLVLFLAFTGHSGATYCLCKDGVGDQALQKSLDYACGAGADCSAILQAGSCYQPNTVKDHCNYAVNSYFQRKGQVAGSCDFSGTAAPSTVLPNQPSGCVFASSPSSITPAAPASNTTTTMSPPGTIITTPTTGFNGGTGLGPTGINDSSDAADPALFSSINSVLLLLLSLAIIPLLRG